MTRPRPLSAGPWLLGFFFVNSAAETAQGVAMLWATYVLTHNAVFVGAINAAAYLPGVVVGLVVRKRADSGHAARLLSMTNWVLFTGSTALTLVWVSRAGHGVVLGMFAVVQCALSLVKMLNKAYVGRFVRERFATRDAVRLLERATSLGLVGGLVGGGAAGLVLDGAAADWCFGTAAALYLLSLVAVRIAAADPHVAERDPAAAAVPPPAPAQKAEVPGMVGRRALRMILVFSVPSSGALPFITTLTVPLAASVAPGSGLFYSVLTITAMCGGFLAGVVLSGGKVSMASTLGGALAVGCPLVAGLALVDGRVGVVALMFLASMVLTAHVMAMQVLTNQAPAAGEVGRFTVLRNSVAGAAKGGFSLLAGWLTDIAGLGTAWLALAASLAVFAVTWWLLGGRFVMGGLAGVD